MRVLTKTSLYYLVVSAVVFLLGGVSFYKILEEEIYDEVDDQLFTDKVNIIEFIRTHNRLPSVTSGISEAILVKEVQFSTPVLEALSDTMIYSTYDEEHIPYRQLTFTTNQNGRYYQYTILKSLMDLDDLLESTILAMAWIFLLLLTGLAAVNYFVNKHTWRHFYDTLDRVKRYSLSQHEPILLQESSTKEFQELNDVLNSMTRKIHSDYLNLKEFTENASHEIQTPLAIVSSKLELLMQSNNLDQDQAKLLTDMQASISRLARLNKSLILLTRIGNREFKEIESIPLHEIVAEQLEQLQEVIEIHQLTLCPPAITTVFKHMNRGLAEVLVSNLLLNAVRHNKPGGEILVSLKKEELCIMNSGEELDEPTDKLFERFMSGNGTTGSLGIGLALVSRICELYHMIPVYSYSNGKHSLCIKFSAK